MMNTASKLTFLSAFLGAAASLSAQVTGFNGTGAGPYDYNNVANWVDETINGIWDSTLTLTANQFVTFGSNANLGTGLNFLYSGNFDVTLQSDGAADRTITLGGDIYVSPASNRIITLGSPTANQGLNVNLGGDRVFTVAGSRTLAFWNTISGGDFVISGTSPIAAGGTVRFNRSTGNAANSDIRVRQNATLQFDNSANGNVGAVRAQSLTLESGGKLSVRGNNTNTVETITGALVTDGGGARPRWSGNTFHSVTVDAGSAHTLLSVGSLSRENNGTLLVRGDNLGVNSIASATPGSSNIVITGTAPAMIGGGGAAGTTTISIIPWLVGGTTTGDNGSTFVTYSAANGLRPLDTTTEFAAAIGGNATDNVRLASGSDTVVEGNATVNSLILATPGSSISGSGTLTVTSGAILLTRTSGASTNINVNLDFGANEGIIAYARGETINGAIAGTGGLTVHGHRNDESLTFTNGSSTYSGKTTILANATVSSGFLPHADRAGDVYVYGNLQLSPSGFNGTINGLWGNGVVAYGNSGASLLEVGDNDATSVFEGTINTNDKLVLRKIGSGTLSLNGANAVSSQVQVNEGTLLINGTLGNGAVTVNAATLGGAGDGTTTGIIGGNTTVAAGGKLAPGAEAGLAGNLTFSNGLNLSASSNDTGAYLFNLNAVGASDRITLTTGLANALNIGTLDAADFTFTTGVGFGAGIYVLFDANSAIAGSIGDGFVDFGDGITGTLSIDNITNDVLLTVVPEPSAAVLVALGLAGVCARRRRK